MILLLVNGAFWKIFLLTVDTTYLAFFVFAFTGVTLKSLGVNLKLENNSLWRMLFNSKY